MLKVVDAVFTRLHDDRANDIFLEREVAGARDVSELLFGSQLAVGELVNQFEEYLSDC